MSKKSKQQAAEEQSKKRTAIQRITSVLAIISCLILIPILLINLVIIVKGSLSPKEVPTVFGYAPMAVITDSMNTGKKETINAGDLVVTKKVDPETLQVGDIIMFKNNDSAIIHRIVSYDSKSGTFTTKGDANNTEDLDPVQKKNIIGKYVGRVPGLGKFVLFSKTPLGILICMGFPLLLLLGYDFATKHFHRSEEKIA